MPDGAGDELGEQVRFPRAGRPAMIRSTLPTLTATATRAEARKSEKSMAACSGLFRRTAAVMPRPTRYW